MNIVIDRAPTRGLVASFSPIVMAALVIALNLLILAPLGTNYISRTLIYTADLVVLAYAVATTPTLEINRKLMILCLVSSLSIIFNSPDAHFMSVERLLFFGMMLALISPLVVNRELARLRTSMWRWLLILLSADVVASAIAYVPWIMANSPTDRGYAGFFGHPMLAGIMASIVALVSLWNLLSPLFCSGSKAPASESPNRNDDDEAFGISDAESLSGNSNAEGCLRNTGWAMMLSAVTLVAALTLMFVSGSRAAVLAFFAGCIPLLARLARGHRRIVLWVAGSLVALTSLLAFTPLTSAIKWKFERGITLNSLTASRDELWGARWEEFKGSPVWGIGFCVSNHFSATFDKPDAAGHRRSEPGSAWLSMLSNIGIVGFTIFAAFNATLVGRLRRCWTGSAGACLCAALLAALAVHGCFEGWVLYGGSLTFLIYWLLTWRISILPSSHPTPKIKNENNRGDRRLQRQGKYIKNNPKR